MSIKIDLTGIVYGRLTVISLYGKNIRRQSMWLCKCMCGNEIIANFSNLRHGNTTSCGCFRFEKAKEINTTHGMTDSPEYTAWVGMIQRCTNPNNEDYNRWGGRGVKVCDRWLDRFDFFYEDMGVRPSSKYSLDRWPNNETGNYEPGNCRWATKKEQNENTRSNRWIEHNGVRMILKNWAKFFGLKKSSCLSTYLKTHSMDEAVIHYSNNRDYKHKKSNVWVEHDGRKMIISDWARFIGIRPSLFWLKRKTMTMEEIIAKYKK